MSVNQGTNSEFIKNFKIPLKLKTSTNKDFSESKKLASPLISCDADLEKPITSVRNGIDAKFFQVSSSSQEGTVYHAVPKKRKPNKTVDQTFLGRDPTYPPELNAIIQPLSCLLCEVKFNSLPTAKLHYQSKMHYKRVRNWITEWSVKTGAPPIKIAKYLKEGETGPDAYHCDDCDLNLTSLQHANQHYNGKRHKMVALYKINPSGPGYYDPNGKWVRIISKNAPDSRSGIGENLLFASVTGMSSSYETIASNDTIKSNEVAKIPLQSAIDKSKYCEFCDVHVTSPHHLEMHLKGFKHAKRMRLLKKAPHTVPGDTILACVNNSIDKDVSMFRTPSGCYYCKTCNVNVDDEGIFFQHLSSKNHAKNCKNHIEKTKQD